MLVDFQKELEKIGDPLGKSRLKEANDMFAPTTDYSMFNDDIVIL